jgi:hypothetical protein
MISGWSLGWIYCLGNADRICPLLEERIRMCPLSRAIIIFNIMSRYRLVYIIVSRYVTNYRGQLQPYLHANYHSMQPRSANLRPPSSWGSWKGFAETFDRSGNLYVCSGATKKCPLWKKVMTSSVEVMTWICSCSEFQMIIYPPRLV